MNKSEKLEVEDVDFRENTILDEELKEEVRKSAIESWGCEDATVLTPWEYIDYINEAMGIPEHLAYYFNYHKLLRDQKLNGEVELVKIDGAQYIILLGW